VPEKVSPKVVEKGRKKERESSVHPYVWLALCVCCVTVCVKRKKGEQDQTKGPSLQFSGQSERNTAQSVSVLAPVVWNARAH